MDETALNELLECSVCLDRLNASSKVLPCQHTFCKRCLEEIVTAKKVLKCPECRTQVDVPIDALPTNILLVRLLEGIKTSKYTPQTTQPQKNGIKNKNSITTKNAAAAVISSISTTTPCARALYNYEAKENGDLSFKKGDHIILKRQIDENWYHGELNGKTGFFPATYVQVIQQLAPQEPPRAKALYKFDTQDENEDCITFEKDEIIQVIRRVDANWAEGKLGDRIGIFPLCFVQLNEAARWLIEYHEVVQNLHASPPTNQNQHATALSESIQSTNSQPNVLSCNQSSLVNSTRSSKRHSCTTFPASSSSQRHSVNYSSTCASPRSSSSAVYVALYSYKPANADELELRKGEFYGVIELCQDGWCRGYCIRTNKYGVFPGNYILQTARQARPAKRSQSSPAKHRNFPKTNAVNVLTESGATNSPRTVTHTRTITNVTQAQNRALLTNTTTASNCTSRSSPVLRRSMADQVVSTVSPSQSATPTAKSSSSKDKTDRLNGLVKRLTKKKTKDVRPENDRRASTSCLEEPLIPIPVPSTSKSEDQPTQPAKPKALRERYRCIAPYPAQSGYEVELKVGDIIYVHRKQKDGWFKGTLQRTGKSGLFPSNFVEKF